MNSSKNITSGRYVNKYCLFIYQISSNSSFIDDLQKDSEDEVDSGNTAALFQKNSHFKKFSITHRFVESKEDVKQVLANLEKEALLLNLIPIAFNEELDREEQLNEMFVNTKDSIDIIWDFIIISFRFYEEH